MYPTPCRATICPARSVHVFLFSLEMYFGWFSGISRHLACHVGKQTQLSCRYQRLWTYIDQFYSARLVKTWWKYDRPNLFGSLILWTVSFKKTYGSRIKSKIWPSWKIIKRYATVKLYKYTHCIEQGQVERVNGAELCKIWGSPKSWHKEENSVHSVR